MSDTYHHGNLRQALIDAGVKIINEKGQEALSLRKVATECGVSHAAPYAHFKDKESLIMAIKETVTQSFTDELEDAVKAAEGKGAEAAIVEMGRRYILFFLKKPDYFNFLFHKQQLQVHLDMKAENENDYTPFLILRRLFKKYLEENSIVMSEDTQELELLKTWSVVQGLSSIACMDKVETSMTWEEIIDKCLKSK